MLSLYVTSRGKTEDAQKRGYQSPMYLGPDFWYQSHLCLDPTSRTLRRNGQLLKSSAPERCQSEQKDMKSVTTDWHFCLIASYYNHPPSIPATFIQSISNRLFKQTLEAAKLVAWREILVAHQSTSFPASFVLFFFFIPISLTQSSPLHPLHPILQVWSCLVGNFCLIYRRKLKEVTSLDS